jgi:signal transduction histidine kinase
MFLWFGASILISGFVAWAVLSAGPSSWRQDVARAEAFVANRFAEVWTDAPARRRLAEATARELAVHVEVRDVEGVTVAVAGEACAGHVYRVPVPAADSGAGRHAGALGSVRVCRAAPRGHGWAVLGALGMAGLCLWLASGLITRRLVRPLGDLVRVARDIGQGNLASRTRPGRRGADELGVLGAAIDDMAARIEKQIADQRQLLAAVSHEIRTPLGHMRVLLEMARDSDGPRVAHYMEELEREILAVDSLVGQILASSRLEFDTMERRRLDARALAASALERAGLDAALLHVDTPDAAMDTAIDTAIEGDPTLLARALANLLENAQAHGHGVTAVRITGAGDGAFIAFEVLDQGPGLGGVDMERLFDAFYRGQSEEQRRDAPQSRDFAAEGKSAGALGLGLALVRRIARAHGGDAWAHDHTPRGARMGFSVRRMGAREHGHDRG